MELADVRELVRVWLVNGPIPIMDVANLISQYIYDFYGRYSFGINCDSHITSLAALPDGNVASISWKDEIYVWDVVNGRCMLTLVGHTSTVWALGVSAKNTGMGKDKNRDKYILASGSSDKTVRLWDMPDGKCSRTLIGHTDSVHSLIFLQSGKLASGSRDGTVRVWDTRRGELMQTLSGHSHNVYSLAVLTDGRLVSCCFDNMIRVWDTENGKCVSTLAGHTQYVTSLAVLPSDKLASGSYDDTVRVWDTLNHTCLFTLIGHAGYVSSLSVLPDGRLVSASRDGTMRVWDVVTGTLMLIMKPVVPSFDCFVRTMAVLHDGRLVTGSTTASISITIWK
jgi:WD40 repeat protein